MPGSKITLLPTLIKLFSSFAGLTAGRASATYCELEPSPEIR